MLAADRLALIAAAVLFSTGGAAIKAASLTAWQVSGGRSAVAFVALLAVSATARRTWLASRRAWLVAAAYAATLTTFVAANKLTTSAAAIFLQSTAPAYLLLLGPWLLRERVDRRDFLVLLVTAIGLTCFVLGAPPVQLTAPNPRLGNVLALASGVCWALTIAGLRWMQTAQAGGKEPGTAVGAVTLGNLVTALVAVPFALPAIDVSGADMAAVTYLGLFQVAAAYLCLVRGLATVPAFDASLLLLVEPALNPFWAWWMHHERPGGWAIVGGVLIVGATTAKALLDARRPGVARTAVP